MPEPHPQLSPTHGSSRGVCLPRWHDVSGQDLAEYAILVGFLALAVVGTVTLFGAQLSATWESIRATLPFGG